ncbi:ferredoxin [Oscillochloris trichoides DG-6]|uniref:Ferredoxin n=1 Tax=Oscillochloris trichoides DG-6 TaxID=765420 RepID=E1IIC9_9CHLR|nr:2Fe-2S iron-sulfur cluster-binding protein [Oscillochloris trichoides]EFO79079.1 ferredoxin [Oscillochloris trichoides DG-6]
MVQVEINDESTDAKLGERIVTIARRNAAHIGFYCDGSGICTMCECKVLSGADQLNEPTEVEHTWLTDARLAQGYRLGCQAALRGTGPVQVLTRAEEMRRQCDAVLNPPAGTNAADHLAGLLENIAAINWQHIGRWPFNLLSSINRIGLYSVLWPVTNLNQLIDDTVRVTQRLLNTEPKDQPPSA